MVDKTFIGGKMVDILVYVADKESVSSPCPDSSSPSVETGTAHTDVLTLTFRLRTMLFTYFKENTGDSDAPSLRSGYVLYDYFLIRYFMKA